MTDTMKFTRNSVVAKTGNTAALEPKIDPQIIVQAFDAVAVRSTAGLDVFSLRHAITEMLTSTGGRPSIAGVRTQVKIPRIEEDWVILNKITKAAENLPRKPSVTQAAALVLHLALSKLSEDELEAELTRAFS